VSAWSSGAFKGGIRSSRVIERACEEDVAFRVPAAQQRPDHATIARFVERHQEAIAGLFGEVLTLCARRFGPAGRPGSCTA
jgi:transposase